MGWSKIKARTNLGPQNYMYLSAPVYCFSTSLHTEVAKTPLSVLVLNTEDNPPPSDYFFLKVINQLHETMRSYAELVFYVFSMSSAVDCRGSKLITPDY